MLRLLTLLVMLACCPPSSLSGQTKEHARGEGEWGSVAGRVEFDGELDQPALKPYLLEERLIIDAETQGIKNVFVYLKSKPDRVHSSFATDQPLKSAELVCRDGRFFPRAMIVRVGQPLLLVSEETGGVAHFKSEFFSIINFDVIVQRGKPFEWTPQGFKRQIGPSPIKSGIQHAAIAWCLVMDHPYGAVTRSDGSFRLDNLPVGKHELVVWHEAVGYVSRKVIINIEPDGVGELDPQRITVQDLDQDSVQR